MADDVQLFFDPSCNGKVDMARRSFIFCDICNPLAIRYIEMRRSIGRNSRVGRRLSDGRNWYDGSEEEAIEAGWVCTEDGQHVCPACFGRMKSMRHVLEDHPSVSSSVGRILDSEADF
jgi:hypothetical protein